MIRVSRLDRISLIRSNSRWAPLVSERAYSVSSLTADTWGVLSSGELGSVFACKGNGESPSLVYYRSFESWTVSSEWQYSLPHRENATVVAVGGIAPDAYNDDLSITGSGTVLVATDKGYVRFFTGSGLQKYVWNLGDEVVTMAAGREWAVVVYRGGSGAVDGRQNLEYALVDMDNFEVVQQGRVPLGRGVTLKWIGFSDEQASFGSNVEYPAQN